MEALANWLCMQLNDTSHKINKDQQQEVLKNSVLEAERGTDISLVSRYKCTFHYCLDSAAKCQYLIFLRTTERKYLCFVFYQY